jgi:hypothetical protein
MRKIDYNDLPALLTLARRERAREMYRLVFKPLLKFFERPAKPRASRMLRRHTAFG